MAGTPVYVCRTETAEGVRDYLTLLPPEIFSKHGLIAESIVGMLTQRGADGKPDIRPEGFARNGEFVDYMHALIGREGAKHPGMQAQAKQVKNGWVHIVDQRLPHDAKVEREDIIGAFQAKDGQ